MPQAIQRQLEEVAEKQRDVEERGVTIEKTIRGETEEGKESNPAPASMEVVFNEMSFEGIINKVFFLAN